mmetsp:Transcript_21888/g.31789  ORF Transcript_21888/g.31789 Transcript_21888/m.31789 type:complete len:667 (-) Transcript_21888:275-2275(-)|eukprot:CAMPEP_0113943330 /NCGR_PEP_ID=MMETSP1339-20121228/23189_1 /TAXON_ID=94617 /ORGANISM="Fibrocapsa japonica" /LENGTH=666 /DNA_ID=CAMNT_0000948173 /DNA_START=69 /DNA_END=2069 /DNA_ORIENTATION=- /assembly_acc=CAM_ASM_000762
MNSKSRLVSIAVPVLGVVTAALGVWFFWNLFKVKPSHKLEKELDDEINDILKASEALPEEAEEGDVSLEDVSAPTKPEASNDELDGAEDEGGEELDGEGEGGQEGEGEEEVDAKTLKEYEHKRSMAGKLFRGGQFLKAARLYTELLEMLPRLPEKEEERLIIINNRSAMYEKAGDAQKCLDDCNIVLLEDPMHEKVHKRMARVYCGLRKFEEALHHQCCLMLWHQENQRKAKLAGKQPQPQEPPEGLQVVMNTLATPLAAQRLDANKDRHDLPALEAVYSSISGFAMHRRAVDEAENAPSSEDDLRTELKEAALLTPLERAGKLWLLAILRISTQKYTEAFKDLKCAEEVLGEAHLAEFEHQAELLAWLGIFSLLSTLADKADEYFERGAKLEGEQGKYKAEFLVKQAGQALDKQDASKARKLLHDALKLDKKCPDIYLMQSQLAVSADEDQNAATVALEKLIKLDPAHETAHQRLVVFKHLARPQMDKESQLRVLHQAQEDLEKAQGPEFAGPSTDLVMQQAELLFLQEDIAGAMRLFDKALELTPWRGSCYISKAACLVRPQPGQEQAGPEALAKAEDLLRTAIKEDPRFPAAYTQLATLRMQTARRPDQAQEAIDLFEQASNLSLDPEEMSQICMLLVFTKAYITAARDLHIEEINISPGGAA